MKRLMLILLFYLFATLAFSQEIPQLQLRPESEVAAMTAQEQHDYYSGLAGQCYRLSRECRDLVTRYQMRADFYHRQAGERHLLYDHFRRRHMDYTAQEFYDEYRNLNAESNRWQGLCNEALRHSRIYSNLRYSYADKAYYILKISKN